MYRCNSHGLCESDAFGDNSDATCGDTCLPWYERDHTLQSYTYNIPAALRELAPSDQVEVYRLLTGRNTSPSHVRTLLLDLLFQEDYPISPDWLGFEEARLYFPPEDEAEEVVIFDPGQEALLRPNHQGFLLIGGRYLCHLRKWRHIAAHLYPSATYVTVTSDDTDPMETVLSGQAEGLTVSQANDLIQEALDQGAIVLDQIWFSRNTLKDYIYAYHQIREFP